MVHLIYLHQGHTAFPSYLIALSQVIGHLLSGESYIAQANPTMLSTMSGIDQAAERVATEIVELLGSRPEIAELSFVGVSLGGCILERAADRLFHSVRGINRSPIELRYFITFASPLNGISIGWNLPTIAAKILGWYDTSLKDLLSMHNQLRASVEAMSLFEKRICLANLNGDWRVPLSSALLVGGTWPWSTGTYRLHQRAIDGSSCIWHAIILDLSDRWVGVHHAIVTDQRSLDAIHEIIEHDWN
jgi:hypothetical protein